MATDLGRIEESRTRMLEDLAHEMRTPIATLGAYLEAINEGTMVDADADRLGQVLTNLLDDALRHTPRAGRVRLTVDRVGTRVRIMVADDGQGIPSEHLAHMFDRFYRVGRARHRAHGGSGVGLSIARTITETHGGMIAVHSEGQGRGAVFTITLPVAPSAPG